MVTSLGPSWFLEVDVIFDVIFMLVTGIVTMVGFRAYNFFKEKKYRLHSTGFLFLCASYLLLAITNLIVLLELRDIQYSLKELVEVMNFNAIASLLYMLLFLVGLTFLLIIYLRIENLSVRLLLFTLVVFSVLLSHQLQSSFYVLISILLLFIIAKLFQNYRAKRRTAPLLVLLGFVALFIGEVLLSVLFLGPTLYVAAGIVTLIGYLLILASLVVA